jgi:hypothetical protein
MDKSNNIPIHHVDAVVLKYIIIIIISFGNLSLYPIIDQHVSKAVKAYSYSTYVLKMQQIFTCKLSPYFNPSYF